MYKFFTKLLVIPKSVFLFLVIPCLFAQVVEAQSSTVRTLDVKGIESITVTSTRVDSDLLKTPIAISAFDMDNQMEGRFEEMSDVAYQVPGLTIGNTGNSAFPEIFIRGVGSADPSMASDPSIGFYIDDVYVGRGMGMFTNLFDLKRVEVIKGPQGALWGRNTLGGAIHLVTKSPSPDSKNQLNFNVGNFSELSIGGLYSARIGERAIGKIAFNRHKRDGYSFNTFNNSDLADADSLGIRGSLLYQLSNSSEWLLSIDYTRDRATSAAFDPLILGTPVLGGAVGDINVTDTPFNHVEPSGEYVVNNRPDAREHRDIYGVSGKYTLDFNGYTFTSITSFRGVELDNIENNDGLSIQLVEINQLTDQHQFSQDFRLSGETLNYEWMIGAYYFNEQTDDDFRIDSQDFSLLFGAQDFSVVNNSDISATNYAVYGNLKYDISDALKLELGIRYSKEYKRYIFSRISNETIEILFPPSIPESQRKEDWDAFSPSMTVSYEPRSLPDTLYYGSISRGFRSGGYNSLQSFVDDAFAPEFLTAYQVGVKSKFLESKIQLDTSVFYYDHSDLQVQTLIPQGIGGVRLVTTNAAEATEKGVEIQVKMKPVNSIQLDASLTILDAKYDEFINSSVGNVSGNTIKLAPKYSGVFGFEYKANLIMV